MGFPLAGAIGIGSALGGLLGGSKKSGGDPVMIPATLDIEDAPERVYSEATRAPYGPFLPYMFGAGGVGRQFGVPQYSTPYDNYLRTLANGSQGLNMSQLMGGASMAAPPRPYGNGGIYPMMGIPQQPGISDGIYRPPSGLFEPYTQPQPLPFEEQPDLLADDATPWRLMQDETLGAIPQVWDNKRKEWRSALNLKPSALNSDRYTFVG